MALVLTTAPLTEPVSLDDAKLHLRVDIDTDDTLINALIIAARQHIENVLNRSLITQTWDLWLDEFPGDDYIELPKPPLSSVSSLKYYDTSDTVATWAAANYFVDTKSEPGRLCLAYGITWPTTTLRDFNGVDITFVAGYGAATAVPKPIKQAMLLLIGHLYEHREAVTTGQITTVPMAVDALIYPYRNWSF
jgi:uncharacterized phiE125 gp8 family phage protein